MGGIGGIWLVRAMTTKPTVALPEKRSGFPYTALNARIGDTSVSRGTGILLVEPKQPFDKAGLKPGNPILLRLGTVRSRVL
jgi:hypothetical protein